MICEKHSSEKTINNASSSALCMINSEILCCESVGSNFCDTNARNCDCHKAKECGAL